MDVHFFWGTSEHQIIVATDINDWVADRANLIPMTEPMIVTTGQVPAQMLTDAGYCSADKPEFGRSPYDAALRTSHHAEPPHTRPTIRPDTPP